MSQNDLDLIDQSGASFRGDNNGAHQAQATKQSGATAGMGTIYPFQDWLDLGTVDVWQIRDSANAAWLPFAMVDADGIEPYGHKGNNIASASTVDLATATGGFIDVTSTTGVSALGTLHAGAEISIRFTGALWLSHNATSLQLPGQTHIKTVAGDTAIFRSLGSGNWKCMVYQRYGGYPVLGLQGHTTSHTTTDFTCSTDIPVNDAVPQITQGDEVMTITYTPKNTASMLYIDTSIYMTPSAPGHYATVALFVDATPGALASWPMLLQGETYTTIRFLVLATSLSSRTYRIRVGPNTAGAASIAINSNGAGDMGNTIMSTMTLQEIL